LEIRAWNNSWIYMQVMVTFQSQFWQVMTNFWKVFGRSGETPYLGKWVRVLDGIFRVGNQGSE